MTADTGGEIARLREQFPGWSFGRHWCAAGSGPDRCSLFAMCGDVVVSATNAAGLAEQLRTMPQTEGQE